MRLPRFLAVLLAIMSVLATRRVAAAQADTSTPDQAAVATAPAEDLSDAIREAGDPSEAINLYARAIAAAPDDRRPKTAFMQRMIDFGMPAMAKRQAADIVQSDPRNALAWAVLGDAAAREGDFNAAVMHVAPAVNLLPGNAFIQQTAARLVAWCDSQGNATELTANARRAAAQVKNALRRYKGFTDAYNEAGSFYREQASATQPAEAESSQQQAEVAQEGESPRRAGGTYVQQPTGSYNTSTYSTYWVPRSSYVYGVDYGYYNAFPYYGFYVPYYGSYYAPYWCNSPYFRYYTFPYYGACGRGDYRHSFDYGFAADDRHAFFGHHFPDRSNGGFARDGTDRGNVFIHRSGTGDGFAGGFGRVPDNRASTGRNPVSVTRSTSPGMTRSTFPGAGHSPSFGVTGVTPRSITRSTPSGVARSTPPKVTRSMTNYGYVAPRSSVRSGGGVAFSGRTLSSSAFRSSPSISRGSFRSGSGHSVFRGGSMSRGGGVSRSWNVSRGGSFSRGGGAGRGR
jgi:tetratricopeptide (TPR) repeat protein